MFNSNECYVISYTYENPKGKPESYVYYWLGNSAGTAAETAAAFQVCVRNVFFGFEHFENFKLLNAKRPFHWTKMNSTAMLHK